MDHLASGQDFMSPKRVPQAALGNQINIPAKNHPKLIDHVDPLKEAQTVARREIHENVYITVRAKVIPQH